MSYANRYMARGTPIEISDAQIVILTSKVLG